jgi:hypothetical protein
MTNARVRGDGRAEQCGYAGPASFNAGMNRRGRRVISCDPLYRFDVEQIRSRIDATCPAMVSRATRERHRFT